MNKFVAAIALCGAFSTAVASAPSQAFAFKIKNSTSSIKALKFLPKSNASAMKLTCSGNTLPSNGIIRIFPNNQIDCNESIETGDNYGLDISVNNTQDAHDVGYGFASIPNNAGNVPVQTAASEINSDASTRNVSADAADNEILLNIESK